MMSRRTRKLLALNVEKNLPLSITCGSIFNPFITAGISVKTVEKHTQMPAFLINTWIVLTMGYIWFVKIVVKSLVSSRVLTDTSGRSTSVVID